MWTAFEYLYRDAGNFKAFGAVNVHGELGPMDKQLIVDRLFDGEFFIAEQIGVPPLYGHLYQWSNGPTDEDHCWHEFVGLRHIETPNDQFSVVLSAEFVARFSAISHWNEALSPHFEI